MSKMVRLDEDVYFALKARASKEGKTLSATAYALMHTADDSSSTEKQLSSLESQIAELKSLLLEKENQKAPQSPLLRQSTPESEWARPNSNRRPPPCEGLYSELQLCLTFFYGRGVEPPARQAYRYALSQRS